MSCNGCRVLRKGCSETCMLRPCLQWINTPESQGHATLFLAKFFGRGGLMSFISNVPPLQRPALFQSLLYEACGRTVNPVSGAVGLLWTGNWHMCEKAVQTILHGGTLTPIPEFLIAAPSSPTTGEVTEVVCPPKKHTTSTWHNQQKEQHQQYLSLTPPCHRPETPPSLNSEGSGTTVCFDRGMSADNYRYHKDTMMVAEPELLNLFV
ncbi:hypothetical protein KSS87_005933 [Heliosperma pusillum]|nr:hypothetical protein KSS87_005933 [Heliosperma pusillum]